MKAVHRDGFLLHIFLKNVNMPANLIFERGKSLMALCGVCRKINDYLKTNNCGSKVYTVEFLRLIFLFCIIYFHSFVSYWHNQEHDEYFYKFVLSVEYFFIIGGFFLYSNIMKEKDSFRLIKKIYFRLVPALVFVFILCHIVSDYGPMSFSNLPLVIILVNGLSLFPDHIPGWGDWFIGVYFWSSCLYIALLNNKNNKNLLYVLILVYISTLYRTSMNSGNYYLTVLPFFIGHELFRGISSMGIGVVAGFVSSKMGNIRNKVIVRLFFTFIEIFCLMQLYYSLFVFPQIIYIKTFSIFAILMILISHSYGYISAFLNKQSWVSLFSRYAYSIFVMNMFFVRFLEKFRYGLSESSYISIFISGCIVFGILEYHLIEKSFFPYLKNKIFA